MAFDRILSVRMVFVRISVGHGGLKIKSPRADMFSSMQHAYEHIKENMSMLKPDVRMRDFSLNVHKLRDQYKN